MLSPEFEVGHATARVYYASRRWGGGVAARGASAADPREICSDKPSQLCLQVRRPSCLLRTKPLCDASTKRLTRATRRRWTSLSPRTTSITLRHRSLDWRPAARGSSKPSSCSGKPLLATIRSRIRLRKETKSVSYTHLTLPTILR